MSDPMACPICLERYTNASLLPACGHSFCGACIDALPTARVSGVREAKCPLCRSPFTPGSQVPNWSLRESSAAASPRRRALSPPPAQPQAPAVVHPHVERRRRDPSAALLAQLGVPPGLARIAIAEADKVAARIFLLDNSGSTNSVDGHVLKGEHLVSATRWEEICASAHDACRLGIATGVPCEFHLLNPPRGGSGETAVEGEDFLCTATDADADRLRIFLRRVTPQGVTPLAERLRSMWPRFEALATARSSTHSAHVSFLIIMTDGAPTPPNSGVPTPQAAAAALNALRRLTQQFALRLVVRLGKKWNQAGLIAAGLRLDCALDRRLRE
jgi:hypothetical protein